MPDLYWNTVHPPLRAILQELMAAELYDPFRLVGGTALALQLGHRQSVDIDLFTDEGQVNFDAIDADLRNRYAYVSLPTPGPVGFGRTYFVGGSDQEAVKLDIYYTDLFIQPALSGEGIRMATAGEIAAMKMDVVQRRGRKKDFWDIHELIDHYPIGQMIAWHAERYPYDHDEARIRANLIDFSIADEDFDPICLRGKYWEIIKAELIDLDWANGQPPRP